MGVGFGDGSGEIREWCVRFVEVWEWAWELGMWVGGRCLVFGDGGWGGRVVWVGAGCGSRWVVVVGWCVCVCGWGW